MKKLKSKTVSIFSLIAGILFLTAGFRFYLMEDTVGAIINFIAGVLFFIVSVGFYYKK